MDRTQTGKHIVPIALAPRERTSFNADWLFHLGDVETGQAQALARDKAANGELHHTGESIKLDGGMRK
jgi:hypothetical protein